MSKKDSLKAFRRQGSLDSVMDTLYKPTLVKQEEKKLCGQETPLPLSIFKQNELPLQQDSLSKDRVENPSLKALHSQAEKPQSTNTQTYNLGKTAVVWKPITKTDLSSTSSNLKYGDIITLKFSLENKAYELYVKDTVFTQAIIREEDVDLSTDYLAYFRILPSFSVVVQEKIRLAKENKTISCEEKKFSFDKIIEYLENEYNENLVKFKSLLGTPVHYMSTIQLVHEETQMFLSMSKSSFNADFGEEEKSDSLTEKYRILELVSSSSANTCFQIVSNNPYQTKDNNKVKNDHEFSILVNDPDNPYKVHYCGIPLPIKKEISKFDFSIYNPEIMKKREKEKESQKLQIILGKEKYMIYLKFKIIQSFDSFKHDNEILKAVKIKNTDGLHYLACDNDKKNIFFTTSSQNWNGIWIMKNIGETKNEQSEEKATFRLSISGTYLCLNNNFLSLKSDPENFTLKHLANQNLPPNAMKLYADSGKEYVTMSKEKNVQKNDSKENVDDIQDHSDKQKGIIEKNKHRTTSNIFECESISDSNRLICSFYVNFLYATQKSINTKYTELDISNIIKAVKEIQCFIKNTSGRAIDSNYKIGFPVVERLKILNSIELDKCCKNLLSSINSIFPITLVDEKNIFIKKISKMLSLLLSNDEKILQNMLRDINHFDGPVKLNIFIYIFDKILSKNELQSGKLLKQKIKFLPEISPNLFNIQVLKILQKMILWREKYDEVAQMLIYDLLFNEYELIRDDIANIYTERVDERYQLTIKKRDLQESDEGIINEEIILLANLAYGQNKKGSDMLRQNFPFEHVVQLIVENRVSPRLFPGLLRILDFGYINYQKHFKHICCKCYNISFISKLFPPTYSVLLNPIQINKLWELIISLLSNSEIKNNETIIYETLLLAYDFLRFNLIWEIKDTLSEEEKKQKEKPKEFTLEPIIKFLNLLFEILGNISYECKDYYLKSKIRENNLKIEKNDDFNPALKMSYFESECTINHFLQKKIFPSNISLLQQIDEVICRIFIFYNKLRKETLVINSLSYLYNQKEFNLKDERQLETVKNRILPGPLFQNYCGKVLPCIEDCYEEYRKTQKPENKINLFAQEINKESHKQFNFMDNMVMLINRCLPQEHDVKHMAMDIILNKTIENTLVLQSLNSMSLIIGDEEKGLYESMKELLYIKLLPNLEKFSHTIDSPDIKRGDTNIAIFSLLQDIFGMFNWDKYKEKCGNTLAQNVFRNLHGHKILMQFLSENQETFNNRQSHDDDYLKLKKLKEENIGYQYTKIVDRIYKIFRAFCSGNEMNKTLLWLWKQHIVSTDKKISIKEINLLYEIIKENKKTIEWFECSSFVIDLEHKIKDIQINKNKHFIVSILKIIMILFEVHKCDEQIPLSKIFTLLLQITKKRKESEHTKMEERKKEEKQQAKNKSKKNPAANGNKDMGNSISGSIIQDKPDTLSNSTDMKNSKNFGICPSDKGKDGIKKDLNKRSGTGKDSTVKDTAGKSRDPQMSILNGKEEQDQRENEIKMKEVEFNENDFEALIVIEYSIKYYIDKGVESKTIKDEKIFSHENIFDTLINISNVIINNADSEYWKKLLTISVNSFFTMYNFVFNELFLQGTIEERKTVSQKINSICDTFEKAEFSKLYDIFNLNKLPEMNGIFLNALRNIIIKNAISENRKEEYKDENIKENNIFRKIESEHSKLKMTEKPPENLQEEKKDDPDNNLELLKKKEIQEALISISRMPNSLTIENNNVIEIIKDQFTKYENNSEDPLVFTYMLFLLNIFELYSQAQEKNGSNTRVFKIFLCFIKLLKSIIQNKEDELEINPEKLKLQTVITSKFIQMKAIDMIFNRLVSRYQQNEISIQTNLLDFLNAILILEGDKGKQLLLDTMKTREETEAFFQSIQNFMNFFVLAFSTRKPQNENSINQQLCDESSSKQFSMEEYLPMINFVKSLYVFISVASSNSFKEFQNFLRQQTTVKKSTNLIRMTVLFLKRILQCLQKKNFLSIALEPLRAIVKCIQGPNDENISVVSTEIFYIVKIIYSELRIEEILSSTAVQINPTLDSIPRNNFEIMKLKYFVTEILIELLQKSQSQTDIYSAFSVTISKKMIIRNFSEYYYLFYYYHGLKYQKDLLYNYVHQESPVSYFVVEFGFQLSFLVTEMQNIPQFHEIEDYEKLFSLIKESQTKSEGFFSKIKNLCTSRRSIYKDLDDEDKQLESVVKLHQEVFNKFTGVVEINNGTNHEIMYFPKHLQAFDKEEIKKFKETVNRNSAQTRTEGIIQSAPNIIHTVDIMHKIVKKWKSFFLFHFIYWCMNFAQNLSILLSLCLNIMILMGDTFDKSIEDMATISISDVPIYIQVCGGILVCLDFIIALNVVVQKIPLYYIKASDPNWNLFKKNKTSRSSRKIISSFLSLVFYDVIMWYYLSALMMAVLGLSYHPFFYCYQLSLIFVRSYTMQNLLRSIFGPLTQIVMTLVIMVIVIYYFAIYAFLRFSVDYPNNTCNTLLNCFFISFDQTFKIDGGLASYMNSPYGSPGANLNLERFLFDNVYAFIVVTLIAEMISGIIVDKFKSLREEEESLTSDFQKECFVCGKSRMVLEMNTTDGFQEHISTKHNLYNYFFFIAYLLEKPQQELNSSEAYVLNKIHDKQHDWIPGHSEPCNEAI